MSLFNINLNILIQIFNKKTPIFLIQIAILILTIIIKYQQSPYNYNHKNINNLLPEQQQYKQQQYTQIQSFIQIFKQFISYVIILYSTKIVIKILVLEVLQCIIKEINQKIKYLAYLILIICDILLIIYGIIILNKQCSPYQQKSLTNNSINNNNIIKLTYLQPYCTYLLFYVWFNCFLYFGVIVYILDQICQDKQITVLNKNYINSNSNNNRDQEMNKNDRMKNQDKNEEQQNNNELF